MAKLKQKDFNKAADYFYRMQRDETAHQNSRMMWIIITQTLVFAGICTIMVFVIQNNKLRVLNIDSNKMVIPIEHDCDIYSGYDGMFCLCRNGKEGLIDINNKILIPFKYDDICFEYLFDQIHYTGLCKIKNGGK